MNRTVLQIFLLLAFIPLAILVGYGVLVVAPIFCCFLAINSYKFKNYKEMYIWMGVGALSFILALYMLGVYDFDKNYYFLYFCTFLIAGISNHGITRCEYNVFLPITAESIQEAHFARSYAGFVTAVGYLSMRFLYSSSKVQVGTVVLIY